LSEIAIGDGRSINSARSSFLSDDYARLRRLEDTITGRRPPILRPSALSLRAEHVSKAQSRDNGPLSRLLPRTCAIPIQSRPLSDRRRNVWFPVVRFTSLKEIRTRSSAKKAAWPMTRLIDRRLVFQLFCRTAGARPRDAYPSCDHHLLSASTRAIVNVASRDAPFGSRTFSFSFCTDSEIKARS